MALCRQPPRTARKVESSPACTAWAGSGGVPGTRLTKKKAADFSAAKKNKYFFSLTRYDLSESARIFRNFSRSRRRVVSNPKRANKVRENFAHIPRLAPGWPASPAHHSGLVQLYL
jgi:hypothetical protein